MKYFVLIFSALCVLSACSDQAKKTNPEESEPQNSFINKENIIVTHATPVTSLAFIEKHEGKTAREAGMFNDSTLVIRLQDLLKNEYPYFQENWNVQTPIEAEKGIYTASGCKQNDCSSYYSIIYFDVANNNINVLIKRGMHYKLFTENGEIQLPDGMKKNQSVIRANA